MIGHFHDKAYKVDIHINFCTGIYIYIYIYINLYIYIYIYVCTSIYIYICVCVCACVFLNTNRMCKASNYWTQTRKRLYLWTALLLTLNINNHRCIIVARRTICIMVTWRIVHEHIVADVFHFKVIHIVADAFQYYIYMQ